MLPLPDLNISTLGQGDRAGLVDLEKDLGGSCRPRVGNLYERPDSKCFQLCGSRGKTEDIM